MAVERFLALSAAVVFVESYSTIIVIGAAINMLVTFLLIRFIMEIIRSIIIQGIKTAAVASRVLMLQPILAAYALMRSELLLRTAVRRLIALLMVEWLF